MTELLKYIANHLVEEPDAVEVTEKPSEMATVYTLKVATADMGRVIGRGGRTAREIRALVRAANRNGGKVMVDFAD